MISTAMAGYLKALYLLGQDRPGRSVTTGALAGALGLTAPSATNMVKKLAGLGLVEHRPQRGVTLTPAGATLALRGLRHHRLLTCYLCAALGYDRDVVDDEASRLAPAISDAVAARLDAALGYPLTDPHGNPIPSREGIVPAPACHLLALPERRCPSTIPVPAGRDGR